MNRTTLALAALLATTGLAAAQTTDNPFAPAEATQDPFAPGAIGGSAIGSAPIGANSAIGDDPIGTAAGGTASATGDAEVGAMVGSAMAPAPSRVRGYVAGQRGPSVTLSRPVVVGQPLPNSIELREVPASGYRYAVVDGRRVIVEPGSRRVVEVVD